MAQDGELDLFHAILDAGSFAGAARQLGVTPSAVSKRISQMEGRIGAPLFVRTTRRMTLTEAGRTYAAGTKDILARLTQVENDIAEGTGAIRGPIRMTASTALGRRKVLPIVLDFSESYPDVDIDLTLTDALVDLVEDRYDLAVRSAVLPDSSLIARRLADNRRIICASPDYVERRGAPTVPEDLSGHACLTLNVSGPFNAWRLMGDRDSPTDLGRGFSCNSLDALHAACLRGLGIARLPSFLVADDIVAGRLLALLSEAEERSDRSAISLLRPPNEVVPRRVRLLVDALVEGFRHHV
ncbi:LysR family transcriptional regulator [Pseudoroseicyclus aestuarii]|uniref:LysR family transcriptional regulator n=1 Tax=Pseudoroseicyclus aestuarii TaxID=1795041 RepID=A0A318SQ04_9RHOB|nr:LysR family transcriptional regulator [Pseudoroseicyclus aestuarii]PYE83951.1 LysR family transcriptional regulator [Pseudoroseicyclus aestuarii]